MFKGKSYNFQSTLIGKISIKKQDDKGISCLMETLDKNINVHIRCGNLQAPVINTMTWHSSQDVSLNDGDIVSISPYGDLTFLYRSNSKDNTLFLTDKCNYQCIMCPQPAPVKPQNFYHQTEDMLQLIDKSPEVFGITGGEPLINFEYFLNVIKRIKEFHPNTHLQILTNGSALADNHNIEKLFEIGKTGITFCIPLYASQPDIHDRIVGSKGAFWKTIKALHNIVQYDADIEIRTVIIKQNYDFLEDLAHFVAMNLPFINHFAIMGAEIMGNARVNFEEIYISPEKYQRQLSNSLQILKQNSICFSVYNHPLCLLPSNLRKYSVKSISEWKVRLYDECQECILKTDCGGIFFANIQEYNNIIKPEFEERSTL